MRSEAVPGGGGSGGAAGVRTLSIWVIHHLQLDLRESIMRCLRSRRTRLEALNGKQGCIRHPVVPTWAVGVPFTKLIGRRGVHDGIVTEIR